ncbi:histone-fold-containing protein [Calycina marina]|uniref:DNA polymerase epsilon subunit D n=1 Tax=Calycina marina TaxID=1763456 RepID=A0A9P7Z487_9HELO|nr:histone-fold-containing protein [Calycina marina]
MPPRKSDVAKAVTEGEEGSTLAKEAPIKEGINIEDLNLPKSIVQRLAKGVLPANTQIQNNAMIALSKSATVFVNYLASTANENAASAGRKTISPQDVLKALDDLEFGDFKPRLEGELAKFNETQTDKRNAYRKKVAVEKSATSPGDEDSHLQTSSHDRASSPHDRDGEPRAKKARRESSDDVTQHDGALGEHEDEAGDDTEDEAEEDEEEEGDDEVDARIEEEEDRREMEEDEAMDNGDDSEDEVL